jgi:cardiolipin synthase
MDKELKNYKKNVRKSENSLRRTIFKALFVTIAFALQVVVFWILFKTTGNIYSSKYFIYNTVRIIAVIYIISKHDSALYKLSWILFIMFMPVLGICVFILWGNSRIRRQKQIEIKEIENDTNYLLDNSFKLDEEIKNKDKHVFNLLRYIQNITSYPVCENISSKYYDLGDKVFIDLKKDLMEAKKYIFMEFYIIDKGEISEEIFKILKNKVKEGLDVRIIYDSYGCIGKFSKKIREDLKKNGVKVYSFNPFTMLINTYLNNRLHRKIVTIDGKISYTGGFNLADEYANIKEKYGHWKDAGIRFEGEISWNFSLMFLRDLRLINKKEKIDYDKYKQISIENKKEKNGIAVALSDGPNNRKNPIESVYMNIINTATEYVYITTPYFAISEEMLTSLLNSARSGVDVRIILPHIPDKKIVQMSTRSYYEVLLSAGVKVYEYKPGFIHSKTFVSDDKIGVVGSANMDYRSMNLNYECISLIYDTGTEKDIKQDFCNMIENSCIEVKLKDWIKRPLLIKVMESILTTFSTMF